MAKKCKYCAAELPEKALFCPACGKPVSSAEALICPECQEKNSPEANFCKQCGTALARPAASKSPGVASLHSQYSWIILSVVGMALLVVGIYYYIGFVKTIEGKSDPHRQVAPAPQAQTLSEEVEHNHPVPDEADIRAAVERVKADPENPALNVQAGNILFDSGRFSEAIPYYQKALSREPNNPDVIVDLGVCYFNLEDYPKAQEQFERALKIDPRHINALYNLGVVAVQFKEINKLIEYWGRLREIAPNSPQAQRAQMILNELHRNVEGGMGPGNSP